jgi:hypothetical protein
MEGKAMPFDGVGPAFGDRTSKIDKVIDLLATPERWCQGTGYQWGPWSIEEEGSYRHNKVFRYLGLPWNHLPSGPFNGQRNSYALMTNIIYNYDLTDIHLFDLVVPLSLHGGLGIGPCASSTRCR